MNKRMTIMIIALVIVFGGIVGWNMLRSFMMKKYFATYQAPPITLSAIKATATVWQPELQAIGALQAINGVNVTSENDGQIVKIFFNSGDVVKAGQLLVQQDIAVDEQNLKGYQASLDFYKITYQRSLDLSKKGFVSKSDLDQTLSSLQQAQANVAKTQVVINQKMIKAPFDGKIGIRQANLGQYLKTGDTIAPLQQLNPLRVIFTLPEQNFSQLNVNQAVILKTDAYPNKAFNGKITALNSEVNNDTRNIQVEALIENPNLLLYPGMFANVSVVLPQRENVVTIPQTAVAYSLYGDSVYVLEPEKNDQDADDKKKDKKASEQQVYIPKQVFVTLGERRGGQVEIVDGLKAGQLVATSGQLKITPKSRVVIDNSINITSAQTVDTPY